MHNGTSSGNGILSSTVLHRYPRQDGQLLEFCSHVSKHGLQQMMALQHLGTTPFLMPSISLQTTHESISLSWTVILVDCIFFSICVWLSNLLDKMPTHDGSFVLLADAGTTLFLTWGVAGSSRSESDDKSMFLYGRFGLLLKRPYWSFLTALISFDVFQNLAPIHV